MKEQEGIQKENIFTKDELNQVNPFASLNTIQSPIENLEDSIIPEKIQNNVVDNLMNPNYQMPQNENFIPKENNYEEIYQLKKEINNLETKLKERKMAISIPAVVILIIILNLSWFLGVHFIIYPKFEEAVKLNNQMKNDYETLKRKVNAIVGD